MVKYYVQCIMLIQLLYQELFMFVKCENVDRLPKMLKVPWSDPIGQASADKYIKGSDQ